MRSCSLRTSAQLAAVTAALVAAGGPRPAPPALAAGAGPAAIACKALEVKTAPEARATAVIFHQAETAEREALGAWLRAHDDSAVELETPDGQWHPARVFRLRSCFGRGLLLFPAASAHLEEGESFTLRAAAAGESVGQH